MEDIRPYLRAKVYDSTYTPKAEYANIEDKCRGLELSYLTQRMMYKALKQKTLQLMKDKAELMQTIQKVNEMLHNPEHSFNEYYKATKELLAVYDKFNKEPQAEDERCIGRLEE